MRVGLKDMDSQIAEQVRKRLCPPDHDFLAEGIHWSGLPFRFQWGTKPGAFGLEKKRKPTETEKRAFELFQKTHRRADAKIAAAVFASPGAGLVTLIGLHSLGVPALVSAVCTTAAAVGAAAGGGYLGYRATYAQRIERTLYHEEMKAVFPLLRLSRAERIYLDGVELLAKTEANEDSEASMREALTQCGELLSNSRKLESTRQTILSLMGLNSVPGLEREYGELGGKFDLAKDPVVRRALEQSLQMCADRLESAKQLRQTLERVIGQQEAIQQTLASAVSAMARLQLAPTIHTESAAAQIAEQVTQMNRQTYAMEQAVEEVILLGHETEK